LKGDEARCVGGFGGNLGADFFNSLLGLGESLFDRGFDGLRGELGPADVEIGREEGMHVRNRSLRMNKLKHSLKRRLILDRELGSAPLFADHFPVRRPNWDSEPMTNTFMKTKSARTLFIRALCLG